VLKSKKRLSLLLLMLDTTRILRRLFFYLMGVDCNLVQNLELQGRDSDLSGLLMNFLHLCLTHLQPLLPLRLRRPPLPLLHLHFP
jgi:hypothetical protein